MLQKVRSRKKAMGIETKYREEGGGEEGKEYKWTFIYISKVGLKGVHGLGSWGRRGGREKTEKNWRWHRGWSLSDWGNSGGTVFFLQWHTGSLAQQKRIDCKEIWDSSLGSVSDKLLNVIGYVSSIWNMGGFTECWTNVVGIKGMQNKFLASSQKYRSGAQEKVSTRRTE